ncbi:peroxisomal membrane protein PEX14 [Chelonus insularis]|uniref:peroxisomal membrane protein PEX14 n=1 Tax=Chelonus insularis TaxID=460826 RepID=UPI00158D6A29|nr:peroxisomal membrane protein PEX14 [Chelonus insularis]
MTVEKLDDSNNNIIINDNQPLRETLVNTAVKFLQNPKVSSSPYKQKQQFLLRKGLTNDEVKKAFELAAVTQFPVENQVEFSSVTIPPRVFQNHTNYRSLTTNKYFYAIKEFFNLTAFIGTTLYCLYWFYKKFIEPFFFRRKKKDLSKDESITETNTDNETLILNSVKEMKDSITIVEENVKKLACNHYLPDPTIPHLVQELKQDLASLKGLLLSRKQFPNAPPSIPPWQLESATTSNNAQSREKTTDREDDAASGSSSTNNSDSSLEMIREDPPK